MIPIARPMLGRAEAQAAEATIASGWLAQGRQVAAFEHEFAAYVGATHACAVSNCTAALHLALLAVGVGAGDEVITVSHSFIATANSILYCNATPVFVDVDPVTYNIDPVRIAAAITGRTKAILCVHQMGMPCDLRAIVAIARANRLPVIEDAACAIGSQIQTDGGQWERIGRPHGDIACFSFHPRKIITTGEGGMLTTANREWDQKFRLWRQHGMSISDVVRHSANDVIIEDYPLVGFNYRMTDMQAAIGRRQLERLDDIVPRRRRLAERYAQRLEAMPEVETPLESPWARSNWQSYCIRLSGGASMQYAVMQAMLEQGVATRRGIMCAHLEPAYNTRPPRFPLPHSTQARDECVLLPLYPDLTVDEQDRVLDALELALHRVHARSLPSAVQTLSAADSRPG